MQGKYYLGMDVETTGQHLATNAMIAMAFSILDSDANVVDEFKVCMLLPPGTGWEERCKREFWMQHSELLERISEQAIPPGDAMNYFVIWLDDMDIKYGKNLTILTDNPQFDVAWVNLYLSLFTTRMNLYYGYNALTKNYEFRRIWDVDSAMHGALMVRDGSVVEWGVESALGVQNPFWKNDHDVSNDARNVAANYIMFVKKFIGGEINKKQ